MYPFVYSVVLSSESIIGYRRTWSDCANAQSDLGLRCPYISQGPFSCSTYHMFQGRPSKRRNMKEICDGIVIFEASLWIYLMRLVFKCKSDVWLFASIFSNRLCCQKSLLTQHTRSEIQNIVLREQIDHPITRQESMYISNVSIWDFFLLSSL